MKIEITGDKIADRAITTWLAGLLLWTAYGCLMVARRRAPELAAIRAAREANVGTLKKAVAAEVGLLKGPRRTDRE